ncbi:hypothetical protein [Aggregatibacter kilianii]|uniref:hypothetical protein n=1 Tax=Aggregatibacter kilianii TaxID=2025884 RepID=UPI000D6499A4|nr:hypothetical protein [Aggregatibacter kilianii]
MLNCPYCQKNVFTLTKSVSKITECSHCHKPVKAKFRLKKGLLFAVPLFFIGAVLAVTQHKPWINTVTGVFAGFILVYGGYEFEKGE